METNNEQQVAVWNNEEPHYKEITVKLIDEDGNVYAILGRTERAMRRVCVPSEKIDEFMNEATSGDFYHLLQTCVKWVVVE